MKQNHGFWGSSVLWRESNKSINADPMSNMRRYQKRPPICKALHYVQTSVEADGTEIEMNTVSASVELKTRH